MLTSRDDGYELLATPGAPDRLMHYARLVAEAADKLVKLFRSLDIDMNFKLIEMGAILSRAQSLRLEKLND